MREGISITVKSLLVLVGAALVVMGSVEVGVAVTDEGGAFILGVPVLLLGLIVMGVPLFFAFRDMVDAARKEGRLPPKDSE